MPRARAPLRIDLAGGWTDVPAFADSEGGCVVNATIDRYVRCELRDDGTLSYTHDAQTGGLGASACEHVLAAALRSPDADLDDIAEAAFAEESAKGVIGGRQDQYAACYGGLNCMTFRKPSNKVLPVAIEPLALPETSMVALQKRLVLVDSGISRLSGEIHKAVWSAYARRDDDVTGALIALKHLGKAMRDALVSSDFGGVKQVLAENWHQQKRLHASVTNDDVERIFELALANGAASGKACGAGGGGALVFYASSDSDALRLRSRLRDADIAVIDFAFTSEGLIDE